MNQEQVGRFIAELRKEQKLTQEQLAEMLGVTNRSVSRWENGRCLPDLSLLQEISEALGVSISELLNGRRMTREEMLDMRNSIDKIIEQSETDRAKKTKRLNVWFCAGAICCLTVILDHQYGVLSLIFRDYAAGFLAGALTGLGLLIEFIGFYDNTHEIPLSQRKRGRRM